MRDLDDERNPSYAEVFNALSEVLSWQFGFVSLDVREEIARFAMNTVAEFRGHSSGPQHVAGPLYNVATCSPRAVRMGNAVRVSDGRVFHVGQRVMAGTSFATLIEVRAGGAFDHKADEVEFRLLFDGTEVRHYVEPETVWRVWDDVAYPSDLPEDVEAFTTAKGITFHGGGTRWVANVPFSADELPIVEVLDSDDEGP